jgi:hypothetical protein
MGRQAVSACIKHSALFWKLTHLMSKPNEKHQQQQQATTATTTATTTTTTNNNNIYLSLSFSQRRH